MPAKKSTNTDLTGKRVQFTIPRNGNSRGVVESMASNNQVAIVRCTTAGDFYNQTFRVRREKLIVLS